MYLAIHVKHLLYVEEMKCFVKKIGKSYFLTVETVIYTTYNTYSGWKICLALYWVTLNALSVKLLLPQKQHFQENTWTVQNAAHELTKIVVTDLIVNPFVIILSPDRGT